MNRPACATASLSLKEKKEIQTDIKLTLTLVKPLEINVMERENYRGKKILFCLNEQTDGQ